MFDSISRLKNARIDRLAMTLASGVLNLSWLDSITIFVPLRVILYVLPQCRAQTK